MLEDTIRTSTYNSAILSNSALFKDKTVCDIGAGSGILSYIAVQAGASKVYFFFFLFNFVYLKSI